MRSSVLGLGLVAAITASVLGAGGRADSGTLGACDEAVSVSGSSVQILFGCPGGSPPLAFIP